MSNAGLVAAGSRDVGSFAVEDRLARELVGDLHQVRRAIYWTDLSLTVLIGWAAVAVAIAEKPFLWATPAAAIAVVALYRGLCFIHEISHQTARALPGFERAWNFLIGYPLLVPSFVYTGVHQYHHKLSTYGTPNDPEYLPFARSARTTILFALQSILMPLMLAVRFLILSPVGLVSKRFGQWLVIRASSLTMNPGYRREVTPELMRKVRLNSALLLMLWAGLMLAAASHRCLWRFLAVWLSVSASISFINALRTLGAHGYESAGEPISRAAQLADSIDTPGAFWTEIWAPVGLRFHALHHYFAGIPYHNLGEAWRRLSRGLPTDAQFHQARSRGLLHSLCMLWRKGLQRSA